MPDQQPKSNHLELAFEVSVILKGLDGLLELIGGIALLFISPAAISGLARVLTQHELSQDPHDFIANRLIHSASLLTHSGTLFGALYLLIHGVAKIILVVAVLKHKLWAYPWMIALIAVFMIYQIYRISLHGSISLTLLTAFDALVIWLTWREYQRLLHNSV